ncbi:MAG: cob(I)yrinic acid a,c-diamide adenosyltransferase [Bacillota bacterium]|nr:cob(I)yrinic acid a,c-diamide adenosyltransferase [Bacillota bacterium]
MGLCKGYIQVYTGDGKGKTTAALGQGLRSAGRGLSVYMVQFLKTSDSGELHSTKWLNGNFRIFRFESEKGFFWTLNEEQKKLLKTEIASAMDFVRKVIKDAECDVLILDEVAAVLTNGLYCADELAGMLKSKPDTMEIILTGRSMPQKITEIANLITEMKEIKHYFNEGVPARDGIEE